MSKEIKCVVWDLDNTMWDGTLLESSDVRLKPRIVEVVQELDRRGILQSVASKNHHEDALSKLKEFGIDHYFLYPEIHWSAKSASLENLRRTLNIGIDTFLFIDDQPFELEEVQSVHAQVLCVHAVAYEQLLDMPRLQPKNITEDSARRRLMYLEDMQRNSEEQAYQGPKEAFLASLKMKFVISVAGEEDLRRAEELTLRTNQLNSTGVTYDYNELNYFRTADRYQLLVCELTDKYGSYGKIGLALIERTDDADVVKLLLMSCRVMSRSVGSVLLSYLMQSAKEAGRRFLAEFRQTDRNRMMFVTYRMSGFQEIGQHDGIALLEHKLEAIAPYPPYIEVSIPAEAQSLYKGAGMDGSSR